MTRARDAITTIITTTHFTPPQKVYTQQQWLFSYLFLRLEFPLIPQDITTGSCDMTILITPDKPDILMHMILPRAEASRATAWCD